MSRLLAANGAPLGEAPRLVQPGGPQQNIDPRLTPYGPALIRTREGYPTETFVFTPEIAVQVGTGLIGVAAQWSLLEAQKRQAEAAKGECATEPPADEAEAEPCPGEPL